MKDYVVDLYQEDGVIGDCLPEFYPTEEAAKAAAEAALAEHKRDREAGRSDNTFGWAHSYKIRACDDED